MMQWYTILQTEYPEIMKNCQDMDNEHKNNKPNAVIIWGGVAVENVINKIIQFEKIEISKGIHCDFKDKIEKLCSEKIINETLFNNLNSIRSLRNEVAHNNYQSTMNEANSVHHKVYNFIKWFYQKYTDNPQEMLSYDKLLYLENEELNKFYQKQDQENKKVIYCPLCGSENNRNNTFCLNCGEKLIQINNKQNNTSLYESLKNFKIDSPKKKWTIKRQESKMNYHERLDQIQKQKIQNQFQKNNLINEINQKEEKNLREYKEKREKTLQEKTGKYNIELNQINTDYNNVITQISYLEEENTNQQDNKQLIEDLDYYKNEKRLIENRKNKIENKKEKALSETLEDLDYEYETLLQNNYQLKNETFKMIQDQEKILKERELKLEQEHDEKVLNNLAKIKCPYCGFKNPNDSRHCQKCGALINDEVPTPRKEYCTKCGHLRSNDEEYCSECGQKY